MTDRANPFGDLGDFAPAPAKPKADRAVIDQVAEDHGFPSRQPLRKPEATQEPAPALPRKQRRYTTGRNKQVNIKASDATLERLYRQADDRQVSLAELLEIAVELLEKHPNKTS